MKQSFNPLEYNSIGELPKNQSKNYKESEDKQGFVMKDVEMNIEIGHELANIDDQAINTLRQEIENKNLSLDDLLLKYRSASESYNYQKQNKILELIRQVSDYNILRGGKYEERVKKELQKHYQPLIYSEKTQRIIINEIDKTDLELGSRLLNDEGFSLKGKLLKKIGQSDDSLMKLYGYSRDNLEVVDLLISKVKKVDLKISILKDVLKYVNEIKDNKERKEKTGSFSLPSIKCNVAETLTHHKKVDSDRFLYNLLSRSSNSAEITYIFKFVIDKSIFKEIIKDKGISLKKLSQSERENVVALAKKFLSSLSNKPKVSQVSSLREGNNKFIVGISSGDNTIHIAWSNTSEYEYHKNIFERISRDFNEEFLNNLRSGGAINIDIENEKILITFSRSSGDFGNYSWRLLEKFRENIIEVLKDQFGDKKIELKFEVSS